MPTNIPNLTSKGMGEETKLKVNTIHPSYKIPSSEFLHWPLGRGLNHVLIQPTIKYGPRLVLLPIITIQLSTNTT